MAATGNCSRRSSGEIEEADARRANELLAEDSYAVVDVREQAEWDEGHLPGAVHVSRGNLESRIEQAVPDRSQPVLLYCASGIARPSRRARSTSSATRTSSRSPAASPTGSGTASRSRSQRRSTRRSGAATRATSSSRRSGGGAGEAARRARPPDRRGGLGSPASLYLAAAGVGTLGIVDDDAVDETNLQRQIVHSTERLGESKAESAWRTIEALNPDVTVKAFQERLTSENVDRVLGEGWDVIVDGADNFPTRYLLNDASIWHGIPVVHGSIYRFEGQTTVFKPKEGPATAASSRSRLRPSWRPAARREGVLGVLPGINGPPQANEALKLVLGASATCSSAGCFLDALETQFTEISPAATLSARSAASSRRSPSTSITSSSARVGWAACVVS